jgi:hypothetical protein
VVQLKSGYVKDLKVSCSGSENLGKIFALD